MSLRKDVMSWGLIGLVLLIVLGAAFWALLPQLQPHATVRLGDGVFRTRIADTSEKREKGLSGTPGIAANEALLFIYQHDDKWSIWMKDMNYAIDIVWLDKAKEVVYIVKNAQPESYPEAFAPTQDARYVVELAAGTVDAKSISVGDKAMFDENNLEGWWQ